jgi:hypothetical protein
MKRGLGRAARVLAGLSLMLAMVHCGSKSGTGLPPPSGGLIVDTITLPDGVVGVQYSATLAASGGTPPYTWSISSGSALPSWAALSTGGVISGTPNAAGGSGFLVAVTDSSSRVATQSLSIAVNPALTIATTSLPNGVVGVAYTTTLAAAGGIAPYAWSLSSGALPSWATLKASTGVISGTPSAAGTSSFSVKVTDSTTPTAATATQALSITITASSSAACGSGNEAILNGQYAFNLIGENGNGFNAVVGSITVDGAGHITAGEVDMNSTLGPYSNSPLSPSTYSVGSDNRGCATIVTKSGVTFNARFDLGVISSGVATRGQIMEFDPASPSAFIATGQIFRQTTSPPLAIGAFLPDGGYVHLLTGWDSSTHGRVVCGGVHTNTGGNLSNAEQTCNDAGGVTHTGPNTGTVGSYGSIDGNGRFTETETVSSTNLVAYIVSANEAPGVPAALTLTTGSTLVLAGETTLQTASTFTQSSLDGNYVLYANGAMSPAEGKIFFAQASSDGVSTLTFDAYYENDGGAWVSNDASLKYSYAVDPYGEVTLSTGSSTDAGNIYLTGTVAVYIGVDSGGFAGYAVAQTGSGSFSTASLEGTFFGGATAIINQSAEAENALVTLDGTGSVSDTSHLSSIGNEQADQPSTDALMIAGNGTFTTASQGSQVVGIVIDANDFLIARNISSSYPTLMRLTLNAAPK